MGAAGVGAADDHEVVVAARVGGGADLLGVLLGGNDALALEVAALLRPLLIFEDDPRHPGLHALAHRARDVERVAVPRVHVGHERHIDRRDDGAHAVEHLGGGEQAVVGCAEGGRGEAEPGREQGVEAGALCRAGPRARRRRRAGR